MTSKKSKISSLLLFLILSFCYANNNEPFSSLKINIQYTHNINNKLFHDHWDVKSGLSFYYQTPFYFGDLLAGMSFIPYESKSKLNPDYQSYFIFLGWLYNFSINKHLSIAPGVKLGNYLMNFDIDSEYDKFESEISTDLFIRSDYQITQNIAITFEYGSQNVYTYKLLQFDMLKSGISINLEKPKWLMDILK